MSKLTFKSLYNVTAELVKAAKEPFVRNKNQRAVSSAIDSANEQKINAQEQLEKELSIVSDGKAVDLNKILELKQTMKSADETIQALEEFQKEFFSE